MPDEQSARDGLVEAADELDRLMRAYCATEGGSSAEHRAAVNLANAFGDNEIAILARLRTAPSNAAEPVAKSVAEEWCAYMDEAVSKAPEPLRELGEHLAGVLDEDHWKAAERYLNAAVLAHPPTQPAAPEGGDVRALVEALPKRIDHADPACGMGGDGLVRLKIAEARAVVAALSAPAPEPSELQIRAEDVFGEACAKEPPAYPTVSAVSGYHPNDPACPDDPCSEAFDQGHTRGFWEACSKLEPILKEALAAIPAPEPAETRGEGGGVMDITSGNWR